ncbi:unnamed protein product, partial [Rotaria sp. Silwood1]
KTDYSLFITTAHIRRTMISRRHLTLNEKVQLNNNNNNGGLDLSQCKLAEKYKISLDSV